MTLSVIPAKAGIQFFQLVRNSLDSGFHRSDDFLRVHLKCANMDVKLIMAVLYPYDSSFGDHDDQNKSIFGPYFFYQKHVTAIFYLTQTTQNDFIVSI
jgi:hypothetical protein